LLEKKRKRNVCYDIFYSPIRNHLSAPLNREKRKREPKKQARKLKIGGKRPALAVNGG